MATTTGDVFYYWVSSSTAGTSASASTNDYVWSTWTATTTSSTSVDCVWHEWNTQGTTPTYSGDVVWTRWNEVPDYSVRYRKEPVREQVIIEPPKESTEERRARVAQERLNRVWAEHKTEEQKKQREVAELTAQDLLKDLISIEQFEYYKETGHLVVQGRKFDYVIERARGVFKVEKDKVKDLCIHLKNRYGFPETDNVIGLLLMLRNSEREFLKTANDNGVVDNMSTREKILGTVKQLKAA